MKKLTIISVLLAAIIGIGEINTASVMATDAASPTSSNEQVFNLKADDDNATLKMGENFFLAGNNIMQQTTAQGILFVAGNNVQPKTKSEYAFIAGNNISLAGVETEKDIFVAGRNLTFEQDVKIGRDIFAAAQNITVSADLKGNFSATAEKVVLNNVKIEGDVNLDVAQLAFAGTNVEITGKLIINEDAEIITAANTTVKYSEIERYVVVHSGEPMTTVITAKAVGIVGLFVIMLIVLALFPRVNQKVARELSGMQFVVDLFIGFCALILIPIVCVILFLTVFAAPAGILILLVYIIMLFLSQAFTGFWLGKLIMENALGREVNKFLEALIGIIILSLAAMIPVGGAWISFFAILLGLGLIVQCLRHKRIEKKFDFGPRTDDDDEVAEAKVVKKSNSKSAKPTKAKTARKTTARKTKGE